MNTNQIKSSSLELKDTTSEVEVKSTNSKPKKSKLSPAELELQTFHRRIQKNEFSLYRKYFNLKSVPNLISKYSDLLNLMLEKFKDELKNYFQKNPSPIFAYDIEEKDNEILCLCGIEIFPDLHYKLHIKVSKNIFTRNENSKKALINVIQNMFKNLDAKIVVAHGTNQKEIKFAQDSHKTLSNTQDLAMKAMKSKSPEFVLSGCGLHHFEDKIKFTRSSCLFFKHKWIWFSAFNAMDWSFKNFMLQTPQHICIDCGKPQDVLLYCMEDALASLFLHCWYSNHEIEIDPDEK